MTTSPLPTIDRDELVALLSQLVSINSVNPAYARSCNEKAMAELIQDLLSQWKIPFETQLVEPDRSNVIARLPGGGRGTLLFEAHMDTVSIEKMAIDPLAPKREGDRLYGRGACDTKGGMAAMLYALKRVHQAGPPTASTILFAATVDEEHGFQGISHLVASGIRADGAVVAEPTDLDVVVAHKGVLRWRITVRGKAAHSSKPHLGVNAIVNMMHIIEAIERELMPKLTASDHPLLGPATLSVGTIHGGTQVNTVPQACSIEIDRRLLPGETSETVWKEFQQVLDKQMALHPSLDVVMEDPMLEDGPLATDPQANVVAVAE
ncbi:MAG: ArgE/DapE family deacylase, partial [Pirellulales bacterium]